MSRKDTIAETPVRLFAVASLLVAVWILTYWLYEPGEPRVTFATEGDDPGAEIEPAAWESIPPDNGLVLADDPAITDPATTEDLPVAQAPSDWRAEPPEFREYIVQRGETLQSIAKREYGSTRHARTIMDANPFVDPNRLKAGRTRLRLPKDPNNVSGRDVAPEPVTPDEPVPEAPVVEAPKPAFSEHLVTKRDTLWGIAKLYYGKGHLWTRIYEANRDVISNPDRPPVGKTIRIPMDQDQ